MIKAAIALLVLVAVGAQALAETNPCSTAPVAVQVLGSGGPIADDARAGASYLVWHRGRARVLVDVGGGSFLRFGESGARLEDLHVIALTHLHADHAADLPALLKSAYFSARRRPLAVVGPTSGERYPGTAAFLRTLFSRERGAFRYLYGYLDGRDGLFALQPREVDSGRNSAVEVFADDGIKVEAVGVHHGPVPALGYLVTVGDIRIAFSGDQNASRAGFAELVRGADVLLMDHAIGADAGAVERNLHATPEAIGRLAARAEVDMLVLSHLMARSLRNTEANRAIIARHYGGPVRMAEDLMCLPLAR